MTASLIEQLILDEGIVLKPYTCSGGKLTIGVGRNIEDNGISEEEAMMMLQNDVAETERLLKTFDWFALLNDDRKDALINMHFNLGHQKFTGFKKMIAALEKQDYTEAAKQMLDSKWAAQVKGRADRIARTMSRGVYEII